MFIELHRMDKSPIVVGVDHIVQVRPSDKEGTVITLSSGGEVTVIETYADIKGKLEAR